MSTDASARLIAAVRDGDGGSLLPPVAREVTARGRRWLLQQRWLRGEADAARLERALRDQRFAPLLRLVAQLARASERWQRRLPEVRHGLLQIENARLFGALMSEAYTACAMAGGRRAAQLVEKMSAGFLFAMQRFVERLRRDGRSGLLGSGGGERGGRGSPPVVTALVAHMAETHNGRQFAIEVELGGERWLYKPRPADGELAMYALFAQLNRLRPAAGAPRLPELRVVRGGGRDGAFYGWHEWIAPPRAREMAEASEGLRALRLPATRAARFWYGAGSLAAACFAFGATDLFGDNVRIGRRAGRAGARHGELRPYPVDLEMTGYPLRRLVETGLVAAERGGPHPGLAARVDATSWVAGDAPLAYFREPRGLTLELVASARPWLRGEAPELVSDDRGEAGYAAHLTSMLRGLFDQWVTLVQRKAELSPLWRELAEPRVRVVVRPTADYARVLDGALLGRRALPSRSWSQRERAQLARLDVPYFARTAGGPLVEMTAPPRGGPRWRAAGAQPFVVPYRAPQPLAELLEGATWAKLGVAMRDLVESAGRAERALEDRRRGVLILQGQGSRGDDGDGDGDGRAKGEVRVRWREAGREVRFAWSGARVRVELRELPGGAAAPALRQQLLRLDRLDSALRERFQNSGFSDRATERSMEQLVARGVAWLDEVVAAHGWPGRALVGERAAAAACRLVQHADRFPAFQRRCLPLVEEAAARGEATPRQLAYLTDQVRLRAKQKQRYGTKFRRRRGQLVPFPIEDEAGVDRRRREMGLEPLADYARRLRQTFDPPPATEEAP